MNVVVRFLMILVSAGLIVACAGSKPADNNNGSDYDQQADYDEIEKLLGISPAEQDGNNQQQDNSGQGDDDLLQLLNIDDPATQNTADNGNSTNNPDDDLIQLDDNPLSQMPAGNRSNNTTSPPAGEVNKLRKDLKEKDRTIGLLRAQIMAMEEEQKNVPQKPASGGSSYNYGSPASSAGITSDEYGRRYQQAFSTWQNRQYRDALQAFQDLLAQDANHSLSDNAQFWIGECYFAMGQYSSAIMAFEKVFTFRNSNKNEDAQYKLGLCYFQMNDRQRAREEFQSFLDNNNYKNDRLRTRAQQHLSRL